VNDLEELKVLSARGDFEAFKESMVWADIKHELESWRTGFERELGSLVDNYAGNNPTSATILMHLGNINGRIKAVDYFLQLPDILMEMTEMQKQEQKLTEEE